MRGEDDEDTCAVAESARCYAQQPTDAKAFAEKDLGYTSFPTVEGGKGDPADLVGNTTNFYSVLKKTKYPETAAEFLKLMYSERVRQGADGHRQPADHAPRTTR